MAKTSKKKNTEIKSKSTCYVITGINSDEIKQHAQDSLKSVFSSLPDNLVILAGTSGTPYDNLLSEIQRIEADIVVFSGTSGIPLLSGLHHSLKGVSVEKGFAYIPDFANGETKRNVGQRIGKFLSKVTGLVEVDGADSGLVVVHPSDLESRSILDNVKVLDNAPYRMADWCSLVGLKLVNIDLHQVKSDQIKYSYFKSILTSFNSRLDWFLLTPLSKLKSFKASNLTKGNHAIYRLIFFILCLFALIALPVLSFDYGITWDEPEDRSYFEEVIAYFQTGGEDERCLDQDRKLHDHLVNYGPFVNLTCAFIEEYLSPFDTYETRHLVLSLFALVGFLFSGLLARKAGTWRTAVIVMLIILFTPVFWGHAANNQKDMPFMAFYIVSLFYIVRMVNDLPRVRTKTLVMTGITLGILFSIRVGGLMSFAFLGLFAGIKFLFTMSKKDMPTGKRFIIYLTRGVIALGIAYFIGVIFWPAAIKDPFGQPFKALENFEKFSLVHIYEVFEGQRFYMKDYPWYYGPKMMLITLPLFVLLGVALFIGGSWKLKKYKSYIIAILVFSIVFPLGYIIYKESALYNSWRHILFVFPSLAILAGIGWDNLISAKQRIVSIGALALLIVGFGITGTWMLKNHPYEYMYYNEIVGGVKGAYGKYELDYWCQTPREAVKWLIDNEDFSTGSTTVMSNNEIKGLQYYADSYQENGKELRKDWRAIDEIDDKIDQLNYFKKENIISEQDYKLELESLQAERKPLADKVNALRHVRIDWSREQQWNKSNWDYAIWTMRTLSPTQIEKGYFPPKGTIHTIDVDGVPIAAIVKRENNHIPKAYDLINKREYAQAEKELLAYIEYDPLEEEAYRTMGYLKLVQGDWDGVIKWCNKGLEYLPEGYFSHNFLGVAYLRRHIGSGGHDSDLDSASYHYKQAIRYKPNFSSAHDGLGDIAFTKGDYVTALKKYKDALSFTGTNAQIYYKMGEAYMKLNNINEAANHYNASIQINKNFAPPYYGLYEVLKQAGQNERAMQYLDQYRQLTGN